MPFAVGGIIEVPDGPDIAGRDDCYTGQGIRDVLDVGTGNDLPASAVPMFDQRLGYGRAILAVRIVNADGPDITGRDHCHSIEIVVAGYIGTRDYLPTATIPVFDEGAYDLILCIPTANSPYIVRRDGCYAKEVVVESRVGGGSNLPASAVPMFGERLGATDGTCVADGPHVA